jgi:DNA-binding XRE family transcriptional regulator
MGGTHVRQPGVAALDRPGKQRNYARQYVPDAPTKPGQADEYLRLRMAELTCRRLGSALRQLREVRGIARDLLATKMGVARGTVESLETGDPHVGVGMWVKAWAWMGVHDAVREAGNNGYASWGAALKAHRAEQSISQSQMAARIGVSRSTIEAMEADRDTVRIHAWIHAWRLMGIENDVVDAADPGLQIVAANAQAIADGLDELPADV